MQLKNKMIQKIDRQSDFVVPAKLLNETFATVAKEFGPTKENSPANNAFITCEELKSQLTENRKFHIYKEHNRIDRIVAPEKTIQEHFASKNRPSFRITDIRESVPA